jgi:septum formation protein
MLWIALAPVILASRSAARRRILEAAGLPVEVRTSAVDERAVEAAAGRADAADVAGLLAAAKARGVEGPVEGRIVIGADQTLSCEGRIYHKPADRAAARRQLEDLRGRVHALHAAVAVTVDGALAFQHVETARLTMRVFSDSFLDGYLETVGDVVCDSVGCYQFEGPGVQLFDRIDGDDFTILGLPLLPLLAYLRHAGLLRD